VLAFIVLFGCYKLIRASALFGLSRLAVTLAIIQKQNIEPADAAIRLAPEDPNAHYTRALILVNLERLSEAVTELEQAIQLRPNHYYQWLDLGVTLDRLGDQARAEAALRESIRLAPSFAQPHWQLGNLLFRKTAYEEAFSEMRFAAASNPDLAAQIVELAWVAADGDVAKAEHYVQPQTRRAHLQMAALLAKEGKASEAGSHLTKVSEPYDETERSLLNQTVGQLIADQQFAEAFIIWSSAHHVTVAENARDQFLNPDFVDPVKQGDLGFGWQLTAVPNISVSVNMEGPAPGTRSLCLSFSGDSPRESESLYQLVLLNPGKRYLLTFMARAKDIVSGGPPVVVVTTLGGSAAKDVGESKVLSAQPGWNTYEVEFQADEKTSTARVGVQRLPCNQNPCPIFGQLCLSRFSLKQR